MYTLGCVYNRDQLLFLSKYLCSTDCYVLIIPVGTHKITTRLQRNLLLLLITWPGCGERSCPVYASTSFSPFNPGWCWTPSCAAPSSVWMNSTLNVSFTYPKHHAPLRTRPRRRLILAMPLLSTVASNTSWGKYWNCFPLFKKGSTRGCKRKRVVPVLPAIVSAISAALSVPNYKSF